MNIRALTAADAAAFKALRLRGLEESPMAFGSTYAEEAEMPLAEVGARLEGAGTAGPQVVLGAHEASGDRLVGVAGCLVEPRAKRRHKAVLWGMYVAPEARGRGVGRALVDAAVAWARGQPGVEQVVLTVAVPNDAARALYRACGFAPSGMERAAMRQDGEDVDVEHMMLRLTPR